MEIKDINTLIIPDVHGRDFWREPVKEVLETTNAPIVFLGDYLDPYPYEWENSEYEKTYKQKAIDTFKDIIELKKQYPDRITLLIGNHDCGYAISTNICSCRMDIINYPEISHLFKENRGLFTLAYEANINKKHFILSHAGILKQYAEYVFEDAVNEDNVVSLFNNAWENNDGLILDTLGIYDNYRGWGGFMFGSLVWADSRTWHIFEPSIDDHFENLGYGYNVFGHTQWTENEIGQYAACVDTHMASYIDNNGNIKEYK